MRVGEGSWAIATGDSLARPRAEAFDETRSFRARETRVPMGIEGATEFLLACSRTHRGGAM